MTLRDVGISHNKIIAVPSADTDDQVIENLVVRPASGILHDLKDHLFHWMFSMNLRINSCDFSCVTPRATISAKRPLE